MIINNMEKVICVLLFPPKLTGGFDLLPAKTWAQVFYDFKHIYESQLSMKAKLKLLQRYRQDYQDLYKIFYRHEFYNALSPKTPNACLRLNRFMFKSFLRGKDLNKELKKREKTNCMMFSYVSPQYGWLKIKV